MYLADLCFGEEHRRRRLLTHGSEDRMTEQELEAVLSGLCSELERDIARGVRFESSGEFERRTREILDALLADYPLNVDFEPHPYVFPDIVLGKYGVEVKFTTGDSWRSVANSVFESRRGQGVEQIYILYGKMGGEPAVRWGRYGDCVVHVRTSHVPRFEVDMLATRSLFEQLGTTYDAFSALAIEDRMKHIREYARGRLKKGERLWWLEEKAEPEHSLPIQARLYMTLEQDEKRRLRAEAAILCPQVVKPPRAKHKYDDATLYLLTYRGVLCPQARDLFSAGSVALRADATRGGLYLLRALRDIEPEMLAAARYLEDALFLEYGEEAVPASHRIARWLAMADSLARTWTPSEHLFTGHAPPGAPAEVS
jgi:hypothetical protein